MKPEDALAWDASKQRDVSITILVATMPCQGTTSGGSFMYDIHCTGNIVTLLAHPQFRVHVLGGFGVVKPEVHKVAIAPLKQYMKFIINFKRAESFDSLRVIFKAK
jgi:hypothetical protein